MINPWRINQNRTSASIRSDRANSRPSSFHTQGVNMVFADGHTHFVNEGISYAVYRQILTSDSLKSDSIVGLAIPGFRTAPATQGDEY
jgi:prepilin-type processing-associated H-X9-DG protein